MLKVKEETLLALKDVAVGLSIILSTKIGIDSHARQEAINDLVIVLIAIRKCFDTDYLKVKIKEK